MICSLPEHRTFEGFFNIFDTFVSKLNSLKSMTGRFRKDHNFENKKIPSTNRQHCSKNIFYFTFKSISELQLFNLPMSFYNYNKNLTGFLV